MIDTVAAVTTLDPSVFRTAVSDDKWDVHRGTYETRKGHRYWYNASRGSIHLDFSESEF